HLDAPRRVVARGADGADVLADRELAFAGERAVVDRLVDRVGQVPVVAVAELDPAEVPGGYAAEALRRDPELRHVPRVDREAAVRRARAFDDRERGAEVLDVDVGRHEL